MGGGETMILKTKKEICQHFLIENLFLFLSRIPFSTRCFYHSPTPVEKITNWFWLLSFLSFFSVRVFS